MTSNGRYNVIPDFSADRSPILIAGPTASGKSGLALTLAERFGGAIVNADALQVYASWQVLTARPDDAEQARAPHFLYGHIGLNQPYSVGHWLREVEACLALLQNQGLRPIIAGGTGLYFQALTRGLADIPAIPAEVRQEADRMMNASGEGAFTEYLRKEDPVTYSKIDIKNPARTQRAWEVLLATGTDPRVASALRYRLAQPTHRGPLRPDDRTGCAGRVQSRSGRRLGPVAPVLPSYRRKGTYRLSAGRNAAARGC